MVVSAWWLLLAFVSGGYAGILLVSLMNVARESEPESVALRREPGRRNVQLMGPEPGVDWVI